MNKNVPDLNMEQLNQNINGDIDIDVQNSANEDEFDNNIIK